jgi:hypothetical protein
MKICPVQWEPLFHVNGWTDREREREREKRDKANSVFFFFNFADMPNKVFRLKMNDKIQMQDNQN